MSERRIEPRKEYYAECTECRQIISNARGRFPISASDYMFLTRLWICSVWLRGWPPRLQLQSARQAANLSKDWRLLLGANYCGCAVACEPVAFFIDLFGKRSNEDTRVDSCGHCDVQLAEFTLRKPDNVLSVWAQHSRNPSKSHVKILASCMPETSCNG